VRVLVACEFSGIVREAFRAAGHEACSVDLIPSELPGPHVIADVLNVISDKWDLMIAFPPCTYLARSGAQWHWWSPEQDAALAFVRALMAAPIERIAIENPLGRISTAIRKPDQKIQPWQFGHGQTKQTCLWLKGLPYLVATNVVAGRESLVFHEPRTPDRAKNRSRTLTGIAQAMAQQWGTL
jgi:hypothetical protein